MDARLQLVASYATRAPHLLWLIEHRPDILLGLPGVMVPAEDGYERARDLWLVHIARSPANLRMAVNAAWFFSRAEPLLAERILVEGRQRSPEDAEWALELAFACERRLVALTLSDDRAENARVAVLALRSFLDAFVLAGPEARQLHTLFTMRQLAGELREERVRVLIKRADDEKADMAAALAHVREAREELAGRRR